MEVILALGVIVLAFFPTWQRFPSVWLNNRSYGFLAAGFAIWLVWQARNRAVPTLDGMWELVGVTAVLSFAWLGAYVLGIQVVHLTMFPAILLVWTGAAFGRPALRVMLPAALVSTLAIPVWEVLQPILQTLTVGVNGILVGLAGIDATIGGHQIKFSFGTIEVAQSCAGLSYFMTAFTISTIYALLTLRHARARIAAIGSAVALAMLANWIRVFGLVLVGYNTKMQSPLMNEHAVYGWVIFAIAQALFIVIAPRIEKYDRLLSTRADTLESDVSTPASFEEPVVQAQFRRRLLMATTVAIIGPLTYVVVNLTPSQKEVDVPVSGVVANAPWTRVAMTSAVAIDTSVDKQVADSGHAKTDTWRAGFNGASQTYQEQWQDDSTVIQIDRFVYASQHQGAELIGNGNAIAPSSEIATERVIGPLDDDFRLVRQAVVRVPDGARIVWYWYRVADISTPIPAKAKVLELLTFITRGPPSEVVIVSTACGLADCNVAQNAIFNFVLGRNAPPPTTP